jgi:hypothetical protein
VHAQLPEVPHHSCVNRASAPPLRQCGLLLSCSYQAAAAKAAAEKKAAEEKAAAEAAAAKAAIEAEAKKSGKKAKELARNQKRKLRKLCEGNSLVAEDEDLIAEGVDLLLALPGPDMVDFTQQLMDAGKEGGEEAAYKMIQDKVFSLEDDHKKEARMKKQQYEIAEKKRLEKDAAKAAEVAKRAVFTDEENLKLTQALKKFPGGTINRWEKISQYVGTRTPKEVMAGTKELQRKVAAGSPGGTAIQAAAARQFGTEVPKGVTAQKAAAAAAATPAPAPKGISAAAKLGAAAAFEPEPKPWTEAEQSRACSHSQLDSCAARPEIESRLLRRLPSGSALLLYPPLRRVTSRCVAVI